ncbi:DNA polymerase subunit beta [Methanobacterium petrolearium]|uniref:DNA polymerase subunit beta n=1 Tax=Methanobacterium petrolearium TaxID=710190 RepID=UPI001AE1505A|nr:DNA polymerase subunit beta [Methanobacterium petrolearium]MBP1946803.1 putative nucleotidyltransferase [Methanobacterium petrolearium]BDZ69776.1 DNA polymerase subunit beta [Methanobacterium petrolearium]
MRARVRDFIYTKDDLFLATTTYLHPKDRILSFLRYIPDPDGDRSRDGSRYSKVDSKQAYTFLNDNFPEYLFDCEVTRVEMMGVPVEKVEKILNPVKRLTEIMNHPYPDELLLKVIKVANTFQDEAGIRQKHLGISGSVLPDLYDPLVSDIDFVVYGLKNHQKAMETFKSLKNDNNSPLKAIADDYWARLYDKRIKDSTLSYDEFCWYENRKNNRGVVDGTLFDILATREWDEIKGNYGEETYEPCGTVKIEATVSDALAAFDNPAVYQVEEVDILEGHHAPIKEVASYTHTYSGQAREGERITARGKLEKVMGKKTYYRLIVGTTRESLGEYIKLKNLNLD